MSPVRKNGRLEKKSALTQPTSSVETPYSSQTGLSTAREWRGEKVASKLLVFYFKSTTKTAYQRLGLLSEPGMNQVF